MIEVRRDGARWTWRYRCLVYGTIRSTGRYDTADHALRDARVWSGGKTPALIFAGRK